MKKRTFEDLHSRALKFSRLGDFQKGDNAAYQAAWKRSDFKEICAHMEPSKTEAYTDEELQMEAVKHLSRGAFKKNNPSMYKAARLKGKNFLNKICFHMPDRVDQCGKNNPFFKWSDEEIISKALNHSKLNDFREFEPSLYTIAHKRKLMDKIRPHMEPSTISSPEKAILEEVQKHFPTAKKFRATKLNIPGKQYIKTLEVDILVKELGKGIEYDSERFHGLEGLKRGHPTWPEEDLEIYHEIKDKAFLGIGIQILHIKQKEWKEDKQACLKKCIDFIKGDLCP